VSFVHSVDNLWPFQPNDFTTPIAFSIGAGVVSADLDRDGHVDLVFAQTVGPNEVWWGQGNGEFEAGEPGDLALEEELSASLSAADFDGDGDLDLVVASLDGITLLRLDEQRQFVDVTDASGIDGGNGWPGTPSWGDYDHDGDLDLYEGRHSTAIHDPDIVEPAPDHLWENQGGLFSDAINSFPFPDGQDGAWLHGVWQDFNLDGTLDLLHVNDFGDAATNTFLWSNEGTSEGNSWNWSDKATDSGLGILAAPMGTAVRDFDGDGWVDLWFSDIGKITLFRSLGPWSWIEATLSWAGSSTHVISDISWSVVDIDLSGNGRPSVLITYGPLPSEDDDPGFDRDQPDRFFVQEQSPGEDIEFVDRSEQVFPTIQDKNSRGVGLADLNADGVPDIVIGHIGAPPSILLGRCNEAHRVVVELDDPTTQNRFGVGARVVLEADEKQQEQTVRAGGRGTYSGSDPVLFFGLGAAERIDQLSVTWPDNGEVQVLENLCSHCRIKVTRGED
jgi:hypothetical protein